MSGCSPKDSVAEPARRPKPAGSSTGSSAQPPKRPSTNQWRQVSRSSSAPVQDWERVAELTEKYADSDPGGVDSSLVAIAERLGITTIASLDRRHFGSVRPKHTPAFVLVP